MLNMSKLIVDVDEKLHSDFKKYCLNKDKSIKEVVTKFVEKCVRDA